jgi:cytochrome b561
MAMTMSAGAPVEGYSPVAKTLHWLMAAAILAGLTIGILLDKVPEGPIQNTMYDIHRSLGAVILLLAVIRLAYRVTQGAPEEDPTLAPHERVLSRIVHVALYALMIAVPIGGWAATSAYGAPIFVFWLFELPPLLAKNEKLAETLFAIHKAGALTLGGLIVLHLAGVFVHAVIKRDGVLARMMPSR